MRGGKDEKKLMDPLFPRLHINETERGGPRAPPRNKMALCEEISTTSQKSSSGSVSTRPPQPSKNSSLVPSTSLNHVGCIKKSGIFSFCSLPEASRMGERLHSYSSGGMNFDRKLVGPEYRVSKPDNNQTFCARGPLKVAAECNLFRPFGFFHSFNSSTKKLVDEDDLRNPYFSQQEQIIGPKSEKKKLTSLSFSSSEKYQTAFERKEEQATSIDLLSSDHLINKFDFDNGVSQIGEGNAEKPPLKSTSKKILAATAPSPLAKNITSESGTRTLVPTNQTRTSSLVDDFSRFPDPHGQSHHRCRSLTKDTTNRDDMSSNPEQLSRKRSFSTMEGPSHSSPLEENNKISNMLESVNECPKDNDIASSQVGDAERAIDILDNSVEDSKLGLDISPDDVVEAMGLKLFWKVRRTIAHQQRIFAMQIFELHRLIEVQKMMVASPEMLYEDKLLSKPSVKYSPVKLLSQSIPEPAALLATPVSDSQNPNLSSDCAAKDAHIKLPPIKSDCKKGHASQKLPVKLCSGALTPASFASDAKLGPWCFRAPTGNQWLVPVKSPSEGLIYKPYAGPCPPNTGYTAPVYGNFGTVNLTRADADFMNTTYDVPTPNQRGNAIYSGPAALVQSCFQPYALPVTDISNSISAIEQATSFARVRSSKQDNSLSRRNVSYIVPYRSSCNTSSRKSGTISNSVVELPVSNGDEFQGSSASSPSERIQGDALPLFPTTPTVKTTHNSPQNRNTEQQTQVIKVVPHNRKSANESAARIFRSIQQERKQHD